MNTTELIERTVALAADNVAAGGRPFSCVIARDGEVIAEGVNMVAQTHDPTAHAEVVAIREACALAGSEHLYDCEIFVLAHPCPMCLGALYYCSPQRVVFITDRPDYAPYYSDDRKYFDFGGLYGEYAKQWQDRRLPMERHEHPAGIDVYRRWQELNSSSKV